MPSVVPTISDISLTKPEKFQTHPPVQEVKDRSEFQRPTTVARAVKILICVLGIYGAFLIQGISQEALYATPVANVSGKDVKFKHPLFMVSMMCLFSGFLGLIISYLTRSTRVLSAFSGDGGEESRTILREGFLVSLSYVGAMSCTNFALTQVSYPTQVLVKSAKAVPVVLGSWLMYGKKYPLADYIMVGVVTASLVVFQVANVNQKQVTASQGWLGFAALLGSLTLDGMTGPRQDQMIKRFRLATGELMLLINGFACPLCLCLSLMVEGARPWLIVMSQSETFIPRILAFVLCGAVGQVFVVSVLQDLGSLHLTLITTSRKFLAILLSVIIYRHALSITQWLAIVLIFSAVLFKYSASGRKKAKSQ